MSNCQWVMMFIKFSRPCNGVLPASIILILFSTLEFPEVINM